MTATPWYLDHRQDEVAPPPYSCVLDEQPAYTSPRSFLSTMVSGCTDIEPAPGLTIRHTRDLGLADAFCPGPVATTGRADALPFWLGRDGRAAVRALLEPSSRHALPAAWRDLLVAAGLAVVPGWSAPSTSVRWLGSPRNDESPSARLDAGECAMFQGLVHPFHLGALRLHTRRLLRRGFMGDGDPQVRLRWVQHNEPVLSWVHHGLAQRVSAVVGEQVKPSYVYTATYHDGAKLQSHTDREQCRYTLTWCLDCLPEPAAEVPWPLLLEPPGSRLRLFHGLGDGILFGGQTTPHARPPMPPGLMVTTVLFHFVPESFDADLS